MRYCDIYELINTTIESMANEHNNILNLDLRYYGQVNDCFNSDDDGFMLVLEKLGNRYMTFLYPTAEGNINIRMYAGIQFHDEYVSYAVEHMARISAAARKDSALIPLKLDLDGNLYADAVFHAEGLSMEDARIKLEMDGLDSTAILLDCFRDSFLDLANGTAPAFMPYDAARIYEEEENSSINHYLQAVFDIPTPGSKSWTVEKTPEEIAAIVKKKERMQEIFDELYGTEETEDETEDEADGSEASDALSLDDFFDNFDPGVMIVHADEEDNNRSGTFGGQELSDLDPDNVFGKFNFRIEVEDDEDDEDAEDESTIDLPSDEEVLQFLNGDEESA